MECAARSTVLGDRIGEALEPALVVAELLRAGPHAELLAIVAQHREPALAALGDAPQQVHGVLRLTERNQVAQLAVDREHGDTRP
jgi:hypothetical protein